jgi:hypothetical protein
MATVHIKEDTYQQLALRAADERMTVDKLVEPVLDRFAQTLSAKKAAQLLPADERRAAFNEWMTLVRQRSNRYPPGFVVDDGRENIYAGRGE